MTIDFRPGQFYGVPQFGSRGGDFHIRALAASGREDDVRVHMHEDAHFVLVLSGAYISSACGAPDFAQSPRGNARFSRMSDVEQRQVQPVADFGAASAAGLYHSLDASLRISAQPHSWG